MLQQITEALLWQISDAKKHKAEKKKYSLLTGTWVLKYGGIGRYFGPYWQT